MKRTRTTYKNHNIYLYNLYIGYYISIFCVKVFRFPLKITFTPSTSHINIVNNLHFRIVYIQMSITHIISIVISFLFQNGLAKGGHRFFAQIKKYFYIYTYLLFYTYSTIQFFFGVVYILTQVRLQRLIEGCQIEIQNYKKN